MVTVVVVIILLANLRIGGGVVQQHESGEKGTGAAVRRQETVVVPGGTIVGLPRQRRAQRGGLYPAPLPGVVVADDVAVTLTGGMGAVMQFGGRSRLRRGQR